MSGLALAYSVADQEFDRSKSLGVLNVSLELARRLGERREVASLHILGNSSVQEHLHPSARVAFSTHDEATRSRAGRILWDQHGVYQATRRSGESLLFLPKGFAPFMSLPPVPLVTYVHDTMIQRYEKRYPRGFPLFERKYFAACFRATLRRASLILTNTDFTASEIRAVADEWGEPVPPIVTVGIGISNGDPGPHVKEDRIVVLASRFPHKRTDLALDSLERWARATKFTGAVDWVGQLPKGLVLPALPGWRLHSRMPDPDYNALVRRARALVYFSEYEGFGMPPVEAAALGAAPVYSAIPATLEVMAGAGYPFDNESFGSFSRALTAAMAASSGDVRAFADSLLARHDWDAVVGRVTRAIGSL